MTFQDLVDHFKDQPEVADKIKNNILNLNDGRISLSDKAILGHLGLKSVLSSAFIYLRTPEGFDYWKEIESTL